MPLVLALGNPGARYARTRHNVAWRVVDELVRRWNAAPTESATTYRAWRARLGESALDLVVPLTFMNLSGEALEDWRARHGLEPDGLLVVSDDVYLPVGALRLRARGSSGGHRGLESVETSLGGREYARLRIGVGGAEGERLKEHVLERFTAEEEQAIEETVRTAADAVETWAREGLLVAMNRFNRKAREEGSTS